MATLNYRRNKSIPPCIIAKVRAALGKPSDSFQGNEKTCSQGDWEEACEIIGRELGCSPKEIAIAKGKYSFYIKK